MDRQKHTAHGAKGSKTPHGPKSGDGKFAQKPFDHKPGEGKFPKKPFDHKPGEGKFPKKPFDHKPGEGKFPKKPFDHKPGEGKFPKKPFDHKPGEGKFPKKPFDHKPGEGKFPPKPFDRKPGEGKFPPKPFDHKPGGGHPPREHRPERPMGNPRRVALDALRDVYRKDAYSQLALDQRLRETRLSPEDRRLATSIFYTALENRLRIDDILHQIVEWMPEPTLQDVLHIAIAQILFMDKLPPYAVVNESVELARQVRDVASGGFVNAALRTLLRKKEAGELRAPGVGLEEEAAFCIEHSMPRPLFEMLKAAYGADEARAMASYRPAEHFETIRPNLMRMNEAAFEAFLTRRNFSWTRGIVPGAYRVTGAGNLGGDVDFLGGRFSIQGESSMLAAYAMEVRPGMNVLDACAAPGGKAALLCEGMNDTGRVYAWDDHTHRMELIRATSQRLGLSNLRYSVRDARVFRPELENVMDAVLVDAPCSGIGVMADKPDVKYRVTPQSVAELTAIQADILNTCARYVKVGGRLVYSTCSVLPAENEAQIDAFLRAHPEFAPEMDDRWLPTSLRPYAREGRITLKAHRDGLEGFFIARMRRVRP